ncbi:hypothetical protein E4U21_005798 [Claviceps maximensis]|nr:hypothetical protein E4U21_005798 [Claviceps maximensis]
MSPKSEATFCLVPNLRSMDSSEQEIDDNCWNWMQPIDIDDEDLMFGGKSLSAWYEEDRRRLSSGGSDDGDNQDRHEEQPRGRERVRRHHGASNPHKK